MNSDPTLSVAGLWTPIPADDLTSAGGYGNLNQLNAALIHIAGTGGYSLVLDGWGAGPGPTGDPDQVAVALATPVGNGTLTLDTQAYISSPLTDGSGPILVGDFTGDGQQDFAIVPYNEHPFQNEPAFVFTQNASGQFTSVQLPGDLNSPQSQFINLDGVPTIVTLGTIYQYESGAWAEQQPSTLQTGGLGFSLAVGQFGSDGAWEMAFGTYGYDYNAPGEPEHQGIGVFGFDPATLQLTPVLSNGIPIASQEILPYLLSFPQYASYPSYFGAGSGEEPGMWALDLNNDGSEDLLVEEDMWNPARDDYPSGLQILINNGNGTFTDETATLNPDMSVDIDVLGEAPEFFDADGSGIDDIFFGNYSVQGPTRQANYLLLNDGTGRLYVAVHDQFVQLASEVATYIAANYPGYTQQSAGYFPQFNAVPQADGSIDFLCEDPIGAGVNVNGVQLWQNQYLLVNVSLDYNPATDFTQNVTINNRNGSSLIRTWAGNDTVYDVGGAATASIDGGLGINTSVYSGDRARYSVSLNADGTVTISDGEVSGVPQVHDTLTHFELLKFADQTMSLVADQVRQGDFDGVGPADLLIENAGGALVVGQVDSGAAAYTAVGALGPEWRFAGDGDFLTHGDDQILIENTAGVVVVGEDVAGQVTYTAVAGLGPEWSFRAVGDFLGHGDDQFLIENTGGAVVAGEVIDGQASYTQVAALGPEWTFVGAGDFIGDGRTDFLIENSAGAVVVGEVTNGQTNYTLATALGPEWSFVGTGDFLGDGKTDFLIENTSGAVVVGELSAGKTVYTQIAALGPEWSFRGAGDYLNVGHDQFLIENTAGAVVVGNWANGQMTYSQVAALGSEWTFH